MKVPTRYASSPVGEASLFIKPQRSVDGMRTLLPFQLSSPTSPTSKFAALETLQRTIEEEKKNFQEGYRHRSANHFSWKSGKAHRDLPVYAPKNSPILEYPYSSSTEFRASTSLPDLTSNKPFIINDYELIDSDAETCTNGTNSKRTSYLSVQSVHWEDFGMDRGRFRESSIDIRRPSDLTTLVENEAAWLSSPLNKWNDGRSECLPYVLSRSMPMREVYSDERSSISEEDEDILACATALATSKANVIEVNTRRPSGLAINIPPRTSSLLTTLVGSENARQARNSWQTFGADSSFFEDDSSSEEEIDREVHEINSLTATRSNPPKLNSRFLLDSLDRPCSPSIMSEDSFVAPGDNDEDEDENDEGDEEDEQDEHDEQEAAPSMYESDDGQSVRETTQKNDSLHEILSQLEFHLQAFPSKMLVDRSDCVIAMRKYLNFPDLPHDSEHFQSDAPPSPAPSEGSLSFDDIPDSTHNIYQFIPTAHALDSSSAIRFEKPLGIQPSLPLDLTPLARIFPETSNFMRSALYAHIIAYIFLTSLTPASISASRAANKRDSLRTFHSRSGSIPTKAAELLGMTERERLNTDVQIPSATKLLEDHLVFYISTLVTEMERSFDVVAAGAGEQKRISMTMLLTLVEVVRGIERGA